MYIKVLALLSYTDFDWSPDGKEGFIWRRQKFEAVEINTIKNHMRSVSDMSVSHMCDWHSAEATERTERRHSGREGFLSVRCASSSSPCLWTCRDASSDGFRRPAQRAIDALCSLESHLCLYVLCWASGIQCHCSLRSPWLRRIACSLVESQKLQPRNTIARGLSPWITSADDGQENQTSRRLKSCWIICSVKYNPSFTVLNAWTFTESRQ